jgi:hypothetical protein
VKEAATSADEDSNKVVRPFEQRIKQREHPAWMMFKKASSGIKVGGSIVRSYVQILQKVYGILKET